MPRTERPLEIYAALSDSVGPRVRVPSGTAFGIENFLAVRDMKTCPCEPQHLRVTWSSSQKSASHFNIRCIRVLWNSLCFSIRICVLRRGRLPLQFVGQLTINQSQGHRRLGVGQAHNPAGVLPHPGQRRVVQPSLHGSGKDLFGKIPSAMSSGEDHQIQPVGGENRIPPGAFRETAFQQPDIVPQSVAGKVFKLLPAKGREGAVQHRADGVQIAAGGDPPSGGKFRRYC